MPQDHAASVQGVSLRVTRLDPSGNLLGGPTDSYTTTAFIRVSFTPEYEEGDEITEKAADGTVCISYKAPDTLKRVNLEIAICNPDPELSNLLSGGLVLSGIDSGNEVAKGWASAQVGEDPSGNGVSVETWSRAVQNGKPAVSNPFFHWVFPYVKTRLSGDRVVENGLLATTFEGFGLGNINFRSGPDRSWKWPAAADRPYLYARSPWAPQGLNGFYQWVPPATGSSSPTATAGPTSYNDPDAYNVLGSGNPYPYDNSKAVDYVLSDSDYVSNGTASASYPASAATQDVLNAPPTGASGLVSNAVVYNKRATGPTGTGATPATGATAGTPGAFTPTGATRPANLAALQSGGITASPSTVWTTGQYVVLADNSEAYWTGSAWASGRKS